MVRFLRAALVLLLVGIGELAAQTPTLPPGTPLQVATPGARIGRAPVDAIALEGAVKPDEYIVGPGDVFTVTIGGSVPRQVATAVSAEGRLAIPEAGSFDAAGQTLASVLARVRPALQRRFANVTTDVTLAEPRQFFVHVSGAVPDPGRHVVRAVGRVEDALTSATLGSPIATLLDYGALEDSATLRAAYRNVRVQREDGTVLLVDIARYFATGDTRYNPYLRDGDRVQLPAFSPRREGVFVSGAVLRPGIYDLRPGDTVADLGIVAGAQESAVYRFLRFGGPERTLTPIEAATTPVGPRDQISVADADPLAAAATAEGAVLYPGFYPVRAGETTVGDLVTLAGGLTDEALPRAAYLERTGSAPDSAEVADLRGDGLDLLDQLYYRQEVARTPRFGLDLGETLSLSLVLRDGDRLVVPRGGDGVRVFGAVARPGFVPFSPDHTASAYVNEAGGLAPGATDVFLLEAGTGRLVPDEGQRIALGDAVFVSREVIADTPQAAQVALQQRQAERDEARALREERRDARQARTQLIQSIASATGAVASIILAVIALNNAAGN
ncbi:MAG: SLBB domain-containing protein [Bacteroidota bacterium]